MKLTRNQHLVYRTLKQSTHPMGAYKLLDALKNQGFRAPCQVYRALDKLQEYGMVHKVESLNSFIACNGVHTSTQSVFAVCDECGSVRELSTKGYIDQMVEWGNQYGFTAEKIVVELKGSCSNCNTDQNIQIRTGT